jgi:hypothetical protein
MTTITRNGSGRRTIAPRERVLIGVELGTGIMALTGGLLLAAKPDGSLLQADLSALAGSPFPDYRVPGSLLAVLVGGGFVGTAVWQTLGGPLARELSLLAGAGIIVFEGAEVIWLGFQPLEAVFAAVGVAVIAVAWDLPRGRRPAMLWRRHR